MHGALKALSLLIILQMSELKLINCSKLCSWKAEALGFEPGLFDFKLSIYFFLISFTQDPHCLGLGWNHGLKKENIPTRH